MLVKVAPIGERVTEVNVEVGSTVQRILEIADVEVNGRTIMVNNTSATESTAVTTENAIIALAGKMKAG